MKGLIVAAVVSLLCFAALTIAFRTGTVQRRAAFGVILWLLMLPVLVIVHRLTPPDLGVLPPTLTEPWPASDLALSIIAYAGAFFGGVLQLYNLADRGLSLRVLIDLAENGPMTADEAVKAYGAGQGMRWMYNKRLQGLVAQHLVRVDNGGLSLTPSGRRTAAMFAWLQRVLRVD